MSDLESPQNSLPDEAPLPVPELDDLKDSPAPETKPDSNTLSLDGSVESATETATQIDAEQTPPSTETTGVPQEGTIPVTPARQDTHRLRLSSLLAAVWLIVLGVILAWPALSGGLILVPGLIVLIAALGLTLVFLAYWQDQQRQAYGAFFLAMLFLLWGSLSCWMVLEPNLGGGLNRTWPLYVALFGSAILLTAIANRRQLARLLAPGLIVTTVGVATTAVFWQLLPDSLLDLAVQAGPWVLVVLAVGLLPLAFRRNRHHL